MGSELVFIDANVFIAFSDEKDGLHERSKNLIKNIQEKKLHYVTSNFVISEVITLISQKVSKVAAIKFADYVYDSHRDLSVVTVDTPLELKAVEYLKTIPTKNISMTDCTTFAILDLEEIPYLATFDSHFKIKNAKYKIIN